MLKILKNTSGFTLIEVLITASISASLMLLGMSYFSNQTKANNNLEFHANREQLRFSLIGQFLHNSNNCKCLFDGAGPLPLTEKPEGANLSVPNPPNQIGLFNFAPAPLPIDCKSALPLIFISKDSKDGMILKSAEIKNIKKITHNYFGEFTVTVAATKKVVGVNQLDIKIPVIVYTTDRPVPNTFAGCSMGVSLENEVCRWDMGAMMKATEKFKKDKISESDMKDEIDNSKISGSSEKTIPNPNIDQVTPEQLKELLGAYRDVLCKDYKPTN